MLIVLAGMVVFNIYWKGLGKTNPGWKMEGGNKMICMIICNGCGYKSLVDAENDVGVGPLLDLSRCRICGAGGGMLDFIGWLEDLLPAGFEPVTGREEAADGQG